MTAVRATDLKTPAALALPPVHSGHVAGPRMACSATVPAPVRCATVCPVAHVIDCVASM